MVASYLWMSLQNSLTENLRLEDQRAAAMKRHAHGADAAGGMIERQGIIDAVAGAWAPARRQSRVIMNSMRIWLKLAALGRPVVPEV